MPYTLNIQLFAEEMAAGTDSGSDGFATQGAENAGTDEEIAVKGIEAMEDFYHSIGMPVNFKELGIAPTEAQIVEMAEECKKACVLACADEFISSFPDGYNTYIDQGGTNVSGGQRQRLCIARALLKAPKVLILDDSTSAVDTTTDANIRRAFREEIPNTTKFIIAQRISSVQDADRIIVLNDGAIDGFGTHDELIKTNEIYRTIYEAQTGAGSGDFDENGGEN